MFVSTIRLLLLGLVVALSLSGTGAGASPGPEGMGRGASCVGLDPPSDGVITAPFAPGPSYSGHWGVDYMLDSDGSVEAAAAGKVTFAGSVVGNLVVTVDHGGGLKTSYSYLERSLVTRGQHVKRGVVLGRASDDSPHRGLHFSVRIGGTYIDPETVLGCQPSSPSAGLRLVPVES